MMWKISLLLKSIIFSHGQEKPYLWTREEDRRGVRSPVSMVALVDGSDTGVGCSGLGVWLEFFYEVEKKADWSSYNDYCCTQGLKYPLLVKRLACMVISGVASSDSLGILQPAILSPEMILQVKILSPTSRMVKLNILK
ncbi:hypothetical protein F0562_015790 [Nyssa sinensis]|uniref:Uncharacterized protein n=1 Tax=Nyssa sinensis TaxID=561372 RepID=A0A5J4ZM80_9ASTE|nr:hypothetical protein F0562_015790 [Nyssa sinensis]